MLYRTRIKICGITSPEDALMAVTAGADAIGLVFWPHSGRAVNLIQAKNICAVIPAFVSVVALTVDAELEYLQELNRQLSIDLFQFHGDESPQQCEALNRPYVKALRMKAELAVAKEIDRYSSARSLLLDAYRKGVPGGTGETFNWQHIPTVCRSKIILAGGLTPNNVEQAVAQVRPYAVDVSGGVERSPGLKDEQRIVRFVGAVARADRATSAANDIAPGL